MKVPRRTQLVVRRRARVLSVLPAPAAASSRMDRLIFVLLLALVKVKGKGEDLVEVKGEEEATVETIRDDVETVGGVWGRVRDPESPLVHLQVNRTPQISISR